MTTHPLLLALVFAAATPTVRAEPHPESHARPALAQRLDWRVGELEAELATLQWFAEQQRAQVDRLQARAEAVEAEAHAWPRPLAVPVLLAACGALVLWGRRRWTSPRQRQGPR